MTCLSRKGKREGLSRAGSPGRTSPYDKPGGCRQRGSCTWSPSAFAPEDAAIGAGVPVGDAVLTATAMVGVIVPAAR